MNPTFARAMPNFSHGTAGVAYFLATVGERTNDAQLLDVAARGAAYLPRSQHARPRWLEVFHSEPGNEALYYLIGVTGRRYRAVVNRLGRSAKFASLAAEVPRLAQERSIATVPERAQVLEHISHAAGTAAWWSSSHRSTAARGMRAHLAFAKRVMDDTLGRATEEGAGLSGLRRSIVFSQSS